MVFIELAFGIWPCSYNIVRRISPDGPIELLFTENKNKNKDNSIKEILWFWKCFIQEFFLAV